MQADAAVNGGSLLAGATAVTGTLLGSTAFTLQVQQQPTSDVPAGLAQQVPTSSNAVLQMIRDLLIRQREQISELRGRQEAIEGLLALLTAIRGGNQGLGSGNGSSMRQQEE